MNFHVVTLFPEMIETSARHGLVGQAISKGTIGLTTVSPREFTSNVHHTVDDRPFGGGDGMIMMAEPLAQSVHRLKSSLPAEARARVIHVSPRGTPFSDAKARELATYSDLIIVSSRYGGADQRFLNSHVDEEISLGDFILTGGELAVLVMIDAVSRLQAGVLGNEASSRNESFASTDGMGFLEHPQFTRPRDWGNQSVPAALMSGDHARIGQFLEALNLLVTAEKRPDLLDKALAAKASGLTSKKVDFALKTLEHLISDGEFELCGLKDRALIKTQLTQLRDKLS